MTELPRYRLWAMLPTGDNLKKAAQYKRSYANSDHVLIISEDAPAGAVELKEEYYSLLKQEDWAWIYAESDRIRREQEEQYHDELIKRQEDFLKRFEEGLKARKAEMLNGGTEGE